MKPLLLVLTALCVSLAGEPLMAGERSRAETPDELERPIKSELLKKTKEERDYTKGVSDVCPVHKLKMPVKEVPVRYGFRLIDQKRIQELISREFPFGQQDVSRGCLEYIPGAKIQAKRYVCPKCVVAWDQWVEELKKKAESRK